MTSSKATLEDALKRLAKALAIALPLAWFRGALITVVFGVVNLVFSVYVFVKAGLGGHGHAGAVLFPLATVPFLPLFLVAVVLAHKQGVMRVLAAAVESQSDTLAVIGERQLRAFVEERGPGALATAGATFGRAWQGYLKTRAALPGPVRFVLQRLCAKAPVTAIIDDLSAQGVSEEEFPQRFMAEVLGYAAQSWLRPTWQPVLILLAINGLWFAIIAVWLGSR